VIRTGLAARRGEICPITTLATTQFNRHALSLRAGGAGWNPFLILFDLKVVYSQLDRFWCYAFDATLDLFDLMLLQGLVDLRTRVLAIRVERLYPSAFFQVEQDYPQQGNSLLLWGVT